MILRGKDSKLTYDSQAALAIIAMRKDPAADKVEALETLYQKWLGVETNREGLVVKQAWRTPKLLWVMQCFSAFKIFRQQVTILARAHAEFQNGEAAKAAQLTFHTDYLRMVEAQRELSTFLAAHFPHHLSSAQSTNTPLLKVALEIMAGQVPK